LTSEGRIVPMTSDRRGEYRHDHHQGHAEHGHTHGAVDPTIATSERGIWALKWSFAVLSATAVMQLVVVLLSGSVALLSDTIHNFGDAATAIPLWIAFALTRLGVSRRFTFGYGRVEDLAGMVIVLSILFSAVVAGYQAVERLINPQPVGRGRVCVLPYLRATLDSPRSTSSDVHRGRWPQRP
jgi:divalent metal cation (Fe/Co/Zn/Cd) transporter